MGLRFARVGILLLAALAALGLVAGLATWHDRPDPSGLGLPIAEAPGAPSGLRVMWLGVTTLLFDDGETQLLVDGFFSRPGLVAVLLDRPVEPDRAAIEAGLEAFGISRLAAVFPVHSHYDHAMDVGEVARRTGARVLGSVSTARVARGAGVPESDIEIVSDGQRLGFGRFAVRFFESRHWPALADGSPPMPGTIDAPLVPPAPVSAWREGGSWSILVAHPEARVLVQGSAGFVEGKLDAVEADLVVLGIGGLSRSGRDHAARYWDEVVGRSGARRVLLVHWDDFTRPFGELRGFPRVVDDLEVSLAWLREFAERDGVALQQPPFGRPLFLDRLDRLDRPDRLDREAARGR